MTSIGFSSSLNLLVNARTMPLESPFLSSLKQPPPPTASQLCSASRWKSVFDFIAASLGGLMSWVAAWIEGRNSLGVRELSSPADAQGKMSNLGKCPVIKWAERIAVIPMSTEDRWAGCQEAKLGNNKLEGSGSIQKDGTCVSCVSGSCGRRSRAWLPGSVSTYTREARASVWGH